MKQYLDLLSQIKKEGTYKSPARENMPGTTSLFGAQLRFKLSEGFPILTTKKINFKNIVVELLWFLRGDTNIKYLIDNGCNIWNEDAYNYYKKVQLKNCFDCEKYLLTFEEFIKLIKLSEEEREKLFEDVVSAPWAKNYKLGDCGKQYGWLWRNWEGKFYALGDASYFEEFDQIKEIINGLKNNPMSRRHIISAWNPATLDDMALNACHAFVQFNCRPLSIEDRWDLYHKSPLEAPFMQESTKDIELHKICDACLIPRYYLDCQMYQRSADVFIGVPYNIASYALLTEILAKITGMIPGDFIHTFGDVHIYDNHKDQVEEQLKRTPGKLPKLVHMKTDSFWNTFDISLFGHLDYKDFMLQEYHPQEAIKAKLSTGLK